MSVLLYQITDGPFIFLLEAEKFITMMMGCIIIIIIIIIRLYALRPRAERKVAESISQSIVKALYVWTLCCVEMNI